MKPSQKMQAVITQLAQQHGLNLTAPAAQLHLSMPGLGRLVIEKKEAHLARVARGHEEAVDRMANLEIVFFMDADEWVAIEVTQAGEGQRVYGLLTPDGQDVVCLDPDGQAELAALADGWAQDLVAQGWLEHGVKWEPTSEVDPCQPDQSPAPDWETLNAWADEGICEATDGCVVELDGTCPHGCQSWLLELGLI